MAEPPEIWPLLCEDNRDPLDEMRYTLVSVGKPMREIDACLRRCRPVSVGGFCSWVFDRVMDELDELAHESPPAVEHFANWDDQIVFAKPGAEEALKRWAAEYLDVKMWVLEDDDHAD